MPRIVRGHQICHVHVKAEEYEKFRKIAERIQGLTFKEFVNEAIVNFNKQFEKYLTLDEPISVIDLMRTDLESAKEVLDKTEEQIKTNQNDK